MKYDYFIASRWRNRDSVLELARKIREKGKTVYCFIEGDGVEHKWRDAKRDPEEFMQDYESVPDWHKDFTVKEVFHADMNALKDSEALILLLPAGKSAHIEAGAAYGMGKRCILIGEQKETESLYLIFEKFYSSVEDFLGSIG